MTIAQVRKRLRASPAVRSIAIPAYRTYARCLIFDPAPRVFANSMPKAGTHLLMALLDGFPQMRFSGVHRDLSDLAGHAADTSADIVELDWRRVARTLKGVRNGQYMTAHLPHSPRLAAVLGGYGYRGLLILRDPRDIVVSQSYYLSTLARHPQYRRYTEQLRTFDERLLAAINGVGGDEYGPPLPSIGTRIRRYRGWLDAPGVVVTRFESLIGAAGGGDDGQQLAQLRAIAAHVQRPLDDRALRRISERLRNPHSATFRKAVVGDWKHHFTDRHRRAFEEQAGDSMEAFGYDWQ